jgi:hypothetical protein
MMASGTFATMGEIGNLGTIMVKMVQAKNTKTGEILQGEEVATWNKIFAMKEPQNVFENWVEVKSWDEEKKTGAEIAQNVLDFLTPFIPKPPDVQPGTGMRPTDTIIDQRAADEAAKAKKTNMIMLGGAGLIGALALFWAMK